MKKIVGIILVVIFLSGSQNSAQFLSTETRSNFTIPGCSNNPSVDTIEINYPGSGSIPADQILIFNATVRDNLSQVLATYPTWGTSNGSIDQNGRFMPWATGVVDIWACAGDVNVSVSINVLQGATVGAELLLYSDNVSADELVELMPMRKDALGNLAPVLVPTDNWTIPQGSSLSGAAPLYWVPMSTGEQEISVNILGHEVSRTINVSIGVAHHLEIQAASTEYNADQIANLQLTLVDQRGNHWGVNGEWFSDAQLPLSNYTGMDIIAYPGEVGMWEVTATHSGNQTGGETWSASLVLTIINGSLTATKISGFLVDRSGVGEEIGYLEGVIQMTTDDRFILTPVLLDADDNQIASSTVYWNLDADYLNGTQVSNNLEYSFAPELVGNHVLTLTPEGSIPARITFEVLHGAATDILVTNRGSSEMVVPIGRNLTLDVRGIDSNGNQFPIDVDWILPAHSGNISNGSLGMGNYEYKPGNQTPLKIHTFVARTALGPHDVPVQVILGSLDHLSMTFVSQLKQGDETMVVVTGHDENGNPVPIAKGDVILSSSAGPTYYRDGKHYISLEKEGIQHQVTAEYGELQPSVAFIDIEATLLAGALGSSEVVIMGGLILASLILLLVATLTYRKSGERVKSDEEIIEEQEAEKIALRNSLTRSGTEINEAEHAGNVVSVEDSPEKVYDSSTLNSPPLPPLQAAPAPLPPIIPNYQQMPLAPVLPPLQAAPALAPAETSSYPPLPAEGLPQGWTMEQWTHYGKEWLSMRQ